MHKFGLQIQIQPPLPFNGGRTAGIALISAVVPPSLSERCGTGGRGVTGLSEGSELKCGKGTDVSPPFSDRVEWGVEEDDEAADDEWWLLVPLLRCVCCCSLV